MNTVKGYKSALTPEQLFLRLREIRHLSLDMDGTLYMGDELFSWTLPFLETLRSLDIKYTFLTNNPSKSIPDYLAKLSAMGIVAQREEIYTSALATIDYIKYQYPSAKRLFVLGTDSMQAEFQGAGFELTADDPADEPDAVVVGFDMSLTYGRLCRAAWWISRGKPYIATNPDRVCPTEQRTVLVDCGSICKALEHATAREPDAVMGKPDPNMVRGVLSRMSIDPSQAGMVGDRLYTDIEMASRAGIMGILVLSGEATLEDLDQSSLLPDLVVDNVSVLGELLSRANR